MGTIIQKMKKGRPYYYAVESARVKGKPRIVWQKYLGTVEAIVARTEGTKPPAPKEAVLFEAGGVAALIRIAQRLSLMDVINKEVPKRNQGPTVGHYILLAALNRALAPCSKLAIGDWYEQTVLRRLWRFNKTAFSSQRFWDHMSMVSEGAIEAIQKALVERIRREFGLDAEVVLYDTTNFFTFLATTNDRCPVAKRGHNKAKRHDLRQVGLALLVSRDFQVPLFHKVYDGNIPDVKPVSLPCPGTHAPPSRRVWKKRARHPGVRQGQRFGGCDGTTRGRRAVLYRCRALKPTAGTRRCAA
jgi:hypothetical protein